MKFSKLFVTAFLGSSTTEKDTQYRTPSSNGLCTRLNLFALTALPQTDLPATFALTTTTTTTSASAPVEEEWISRRPTTRQSEVDSLLLAGIREWLVPPASAAETSAAPPTQEEIKLLREAFATFYGLDRDLDKSEQLLSKAIESWQRQSPDEKAGLYRVRGDCYMAMLKPKNAVKDYSVAIDLLQGPGGDEADPSELPTSLLGRARAIRSQGKDAGPELIGQAAKDYQLALRLSSREDWDTDAENEEDGASRNPYAAWEWASTLRSAGDFAGAAKTHKLASDAFDDLGDKTRAVMSQMDQGIDLAALGKTKEARETIAAAIKNMKKIEGGDVDLLQRLLAKEGESRLALASILWDSGEKQEAESLLGTACYRLEQLEADAQKRLSANKKTAVLEGLKFSIDDQMGAGLSCSRFKNEKFMTETLDWPEILQKKMNKLQALGK